MDEPPSLHSPIPITSEHSSRSNPSPPLLEAYTNLAPVDVRILSKGSKKWLGEDPQQMLILQPQDVPPRKDLYSSVVDDDDAGHHKGSDQDIILDVVDETQGFDRGKMSMNLNVFSRHESTNASLLVEAALDSVSDIQIGHVEAGMTGGGMDIGSPGSCDDALVGNLYPLPPPAMAYGAGAIDAVADHISVTDDLGGDGPAIYALHQGDFSPAGSQQGRAAFGRDFSAHARRLDYAVMSDEASAGNSPHYDMANSAGNLSNDANLSSDDSNGAGIAAQNLSLHGAKEDVQLDLSMYKSHYTIDSGNFFVRRTLRKDKKVAFGDKPDEEDEDVGADGSDLCVVEHKHSTDLDLDARAKQLDLDLDIRSKGYDAIEADLRNRNLYDADVDFRAKTYDSLLESDFRMDRNFEPLVLNPSELQGLDMSARTYHSFHNAATGLNRFHHMYSDVDRLGYSPPPPPPYPDVLRAVSLDLTPPGRHSVDLSLRGHPFHAHQLAGLVANNRLPPLDQNRLLAPPEHSIQRHLAADTRMLSDHTTNRILANDRLLGAEPARLLAEESRLLEQGRLLGDTRAMAQGGGGAGGLSPPYTNYSVSPNPFHPNSLTGRPAHSTSPTPSTYHHYSAYY